ncbi:dihydrofolate synthase / folylpolyglutamate synthase [Cohaesibacter sp. ES.047]|uniref:bifunctional folylpolyglutamate synthase/dihydrofolate synthase n=1 Tax=Cohaesibacter sp. ES.047 TaxID=1798205 RepID=UPI000BB7901F|nr:folylpolyglutamate synthase/dihydrofolate synthase family protein [Cohaesibacter sp. ES.047]SNY91736.1 dihydrofolate synthase / folylpolyglutamate synthase [Cohaesibacter sp. ES.047]
MEQPEAILNRMIALHPKSIDLGLGRVSALLAKLGNPHHHLPPTIHIAGTNGKGSTSAFLRAMAEADGKRVHVYTSPHLVHFRERIRLGGTCVSDACLVEALLTCERANGGAPITFFEITTVAAFLLFAQNPADLLILEVGLGGRLDATNVIDFPAVSVITAIAHDHEGYLGSELDGIAREKAGIFKPGVPAIIAPQSDDVREVLEGEATRARTGLVAIAGQDWMAYEEHGRFIFQAESRFLDLPMPRLGGRHQLDNAGTAIAAIRTVFPEMSDDSIAKGLVKVDWPARLQRLTEGRLLSQLPPDAELWLDGGHNPQAGHALSSALADLEEKAPKPLLMIIGMLSTKKPQGYFAPFKGLAREIITVPVPNSDAGVDPVSLASIAQEKGIPASAAASLEEALKRFSLQQHKTAPRILIGGSLYVAGAALAANGTPPK